MNIIAKTSAAALLAAGALAGTVTGAAAQDVTMRIGWTTSDGEADPYAIAARQIQAELEERAPGVFDVEFFPNNQLGDEKQMIEALQFGTLDLGIITNAPVGNVEPAFQILDMPFLFPDEEAAHEALDGELGDELMSRLEGSGIVGLGFAEGGFRNMINNARPIQQPDDVEGVKFRVMQNPVFIDMFQSLGGNAVPMAWGETFTAAQQGTIDGLEIPLAVIASNKYADVVEYLSLTQHTYSALDILASERFLSGLSDEQRTTVTEAVDAAIETQRQTVQENADAVLAHLEEAGMTINEIEDPEAFREKVKPVYDSFRDDIGSDLVDMALGQSGSE
ncbi:tripartite ATP-independent transporter solute receptor, DctP family [Roseivivax marinus]|uniref:TRAP transporter substrate-binding protein n=1 Tax=Roseivivax marinus TaxID=1379903 RepID=UPI0008ADB69A|nr:TRAP transporter substrate-binding protein [Roseivivax marinus]SEL75150.1 tripartite ATP-independent transporter solute receptor, DctP family [Roseivivax marinus]